MYIGLIRNFVQRSNYYSMDYNNYLIPRFIRTVGGIQLSMENILSNSLHRQESSYSQKFREDIKSLRKSYKRFSEYIREFPIIIEDRCLWNEIANYVGVKDSRLLNTNYFLLDFFFPYLGVIVEIDSEYHDKKRTYDVARDIYIKRKFGLDTVRFYKYGNNDLERVAFLDKFKNVSTELMNYYFSWGIRECKYPIDFSQTMIENFIQDNRVPLEFIDKMIVSVGENKFMYSDFITLSLEEIQTIDSYLFPQQPIGKKGYEKGSLEQLLLDNVTMILLKIYGKHLTVT